MNFREYFKQQKIAFVTPVASVISATEYVGCHTASTVFSTLRRSVFVLAGTTQRVTQKSLLI
ncbi:hypothetical protein [Paenibacillus sp. V4I5]|uniref:hypothetical protein n=1 Tax=Paenibacillus sp. V4I5 TaxID=3042306 RepID=UPI00278D9B77|nr:hypothetical protein [Paenibacillus sp. V4I5]MDQ0917534.1 hypothetical protein [Paenibacillus sp. V4I5]